GEGLERGARRGPAARAVAVGRVEELVRHAIDDAPALAPPPQLPRRHAGPCPSTVRTTLPVFSPVSTYLVASTTSSSGYLRSITARYSPASISRLTNRTSCFVYC